MSEANWNPLWWSFENLLPSLKNWSCQSWLVTASASCNVEDSVKGCTSCHQDISASKSEFVNIMVSLSKLLWHILVLLQALSNSCKRPFSLLGTRSMVHLGPAQNSDRSQQGNMRDKTHMDAQDRGEIKMEWHKTKMTIHLHIFHSWMKTRPVASQLWQDERIKFASIWHSLDTRRLDAYFMLLHFASHLCGFVFLFSFSKDPTREALKMARYWTVLSHVFTLQLSPRILPSQLPIQFHQVGGWHEVQPWPLWAWLCCSSTDFLALPQNGVPGRNQEQDGFDVILFFLEEWWVVCE